MILPLKTLRLRPTFPLPLFQEDDSSDTLKICLCLFGLGDRFSTTDFRFVPVDFHFVLVDTDVLVKDAEAIATGENEQAVVVDESSGGDEEDSSATSATSSEADVVGAKEDFDVEEAVSSVTGLKGKILLFQRTLQEIYQKHLYHHFHQSQYHQQLELLRFL